MYCLDTHACCKPFLLSNILSFTPLEPDYPVRNMVLRSLSTKSHAQFVSESFCAFSFRFGLCLKTCCTYDVHTQQKSHFRFPLLRVTVCWRRWQRATDVQLSECSKNKENKNTSNCYLCCIRPSDILLLSVLGTRHTHAILTKRNDFIINSSKNFMQIFYLFKSTIIIHPLCFA